MSRRFSKILVANRGEIACRVFRTAREEGYATVAVYSEADADALHVKMADEAVCIGGAPVGESYLNADHVLAAAKRTGADAIHPGYGFLSENSEFVAACADAGIVFIGPPADAMQAMGNKAAAKRTMIEAGVPCVPGYEGENQDDATLKSEAETIGFPILIKAAAGGGGRGMRRVDSANELDEAITGARSEAKNAFGSDELIIEKLVERARHVEVQIMADEHGNAIHLGERDCSVQRRHQKIIEESPCPVMTPELRAEMGESAAKAAAAVGYTNAGTVEFLLDDDGHFYFLEMNTRLQVEHPVTEMVTGWDLVAAQLDVAQGGELPEQEQVPDPQGHAVEVRLYAEDPNNDFMPHTGQVVLWSPPDEAGVQVRVDHGLQTGDDITPFYDPMIAKIITWADTRDEALAQMDFALANTCAFGVKTNLELLQRIVNEDTFRAGEARITYIADTGILEHTKPDPDPMRLLTAAAAYIERDAAAVSPGLKGWRSTRDVVVPLKLTWKGEAVQVDATMDGATYAIESDGERHELTVDYLNENAMAWRTNGHRQEAQLAFDDDHLYLMYDGRVDHFVDITYAPAEDKSAAAGGMLKAPMAGQIVRVNVANGDAVSKDDVLVVLEAMKMENQIVAPCDGTVEGLSVEVGQQVGANQVLLQVAVAGETNDE